MRILTLTLFLALASLALAGDTPLPASTPAAGRFQLLSGTTWIVAKNTKVEIPVILKIDTQTGQTWMLTLIAESTGSSNTMGFVPVTDVPAKAATAAVP
ncbi:MAG TPA: hypothetical protein VHC44_07695 [Verrucomicrobiae bacterium]|nr:hypothetical protein [Verrucomicrobiae bacterium]